jgi:hypothetical protein
MSKVMARCLMPVHMKVAISSHPKPIFHSRISPPLAKNFATEKFRHRKSSFVVLSRRQRN